MAAPASVTINILGREYQISCPPEEEEGLRKSARYLASQPWPFPGSLMLGFIAHAEPDEPKAGEELEDVRWFDADEVRAGLAVDWAKADAEGEGIILSAPISISGWLAECWVGECAARTRAW